MSKSADAFRTISEVAEWLGVQTHVLRFWESKFTHVKPVKRAGGRRYYRPADMLLLGGIRRLLHDDGLTIKGVQKILREEGVAHVADMSHPLDDDTAAQLDADLVDDTGADVAQASPPEADASSLDHAPEHSRPAPPAAPSEGREDRKDAPLPSFMRAEEPDPEPEAAPTPREPDVPTLTPEMDVFEDAPAQSETQSAPPEGTAAPEPVETETTHETLFEEISLTPEAAPEAPQPAETAPVEPAEEMQQPLALDLDASEPAPVVDDTPPEPVIEASPVETPPVAAETEVPSEPPVPVAPTQDAIPDTPAEEIVASAPPEDPTPPVPADEPMPMFTRAAPPRVAMPEESVEAAAPAPVEPEPTPEPEPAAPPRPRIVDVPDDEAIASENFAPSILTKASKLRTLTPAQGDQLRPLVAQLKALRDQMAHARQDQR